MKKLLFLFLVISNVINSQDVITKNNGEDIKSKVLEVGEESIKYKKFSNLNGPTYTLKKSEILMIRYENGEKDIFNNNSSTTKPLEENIEKPNKTEGYEGLIIMKNGEMFDAIIIAITESTIKYREIDEEKTKLLSTDVVAKIENWDGNEMYVNKELQEEDLETEGNPYGKTLFSFTPVGILGSTINSGISLEFLNKKGSFGSRFNLMYSTLSSHRALTFGYDMKFYIPAGKPVSFLIGPSIYFLKDLDYDLNSRLYYLGIGVSFQVTEKFNITIFEQAGALTVKGFSGWLPSNHFGVSFGTRF